MLLQVYSVSANDKQSCMANIVCPRLACSLLKAFHEAAVALEGVQGGSCCSQRSCICLPACTSGTSILVSAICGCLISAF